MGIGERGSGSSVTFCDFRPQRTGDPSVTQRLAASGIRCLSAALGALKREDRVALESQTAQEGLFASNALVAAATINNHLPHCRAERVATKPDLAATGHKKSPGMRPGQGWIRAESAVMAVRPRSP